MSKSSDQNTIRRKLLEKEPVTILRKESEQFILEVVNNNETKSQVTIKAGAIQIILNNLKHEPAEAIEIEAAIADIEDQLMPVIKDLPERRCLVTSEQTFWEIAKVAGFNAEDKIELDIETVEEIFNRLVDLAYGTPARMLKVPVGREFAASVLFLRELMHHAGFYTIFFSQRTGI